MMNQKKTEDTGLFLIYIDSYENGVLRGEYCRPGMSGMDRFQSLTQLLLKLDQKQWPECEESEKTADRLRLRRGAEATFVVNIQFRRNFSWQGSVQWLEKNQRYMFRSVLELVYLINGVLLENDTEKKARYG